MTSNSCNRLRARPEIVVIDRLAEQRRNLEELLPRPDEGLLAEPCRWVHYPWRRALVCILGPRAFRRVRLDRNRNLITIEEQEQLGALRIGIVGLSVGHAIAHTLATEGMCEQLRLADFDELELTNLNRVPASLFDIGINKAVVAAQRIAEIDPYVDIQVATSGVTPESVDDFVDGLDIVIEECDSLDIKLLVREAARTRGVPVLMASSDRGLIDVERFDEDPDRPVLHGLLSEADLSRLATLSSREKVPYVLKVVEAKKLSARGAAALVEVGQTLGHLAAAGRRRPARRIGRREGSPTSGAGPSPPVRADTSGRRRVADSPRRSGSRRQPIARCPPPAMTIRRPAAPTSSTSSLRRRSEPLPAGTPNLGESRPLRTASNWPSLAEYTSMMDVEFRASAIALGAAIFNTRVAAAAHGMHASVDLDRSIPGTPHCAPSAS